MLTYFKVSGLKPYSECDLINTCHGFLCHFKQAELLFSILMMAFFIFLYTADLPIKSSSRLLKLTNLTSARFSYVFVHTPHTHNHASANQTFVIVIQLIVCRDAVY